MPCLAVLVGEHHQLVELPQMTEETARPQGGKGALQPSSTLGIEIAIVGAIYVQLTYLAAAVTNAVDEIYLASQHTDCDIGAQEQQLFGEQPLEAALLSEIHKDFLKKGARPEFFEIDVEMHYLYLVGQRIEQWSALSLSEYDGNVVAEVLSKVVGLERQHTFNSSCHIKCRCDIDYFQRLLIHDRFGLCHKITKIN